MPFDLDATTQIFQPHDNGGIQQVIADNPSDTAQIALIRAHFQEEAAKFQRGHFSDLTTIPSMDMPAAQLQAGYAHIAVTSTELPNGAQLRHRDQTAPANALGDDGSTSGGDQHGFEPMSSVASWFLTSTRCWNWRVS